MAEQRLVMGGHLLLLVVQLVHRKGHPRVVLGETFAEGLQVRLMDGVVFGRLVFPFVFLLVVYRM